MDFQAIIKNNEDRDICICLEYPDGGRQMTVLKNYRILDVHGSLADRCAVQSKDACRRVDLFKDAAVLSLKKGIIMITIKAVYYNTMYRIYITDDIVEEHFSF